MHTEIAWWSKQKTINLSTPNARSKKKSFKRETISQTKSFHKITSGTLNKVKAWTNSVVRALD